MGLETVRNGPNIRKFFMKDGDGFVETTGVSR